MTRVVALAGALCGAPAWPRSGWAQLAAADSLSPTDSLAAIDSVATAPGSWLPAAPSDVEAPDRLEDRDPVRGFGARADRRDGRWSPRHFWIDGALGPVRAVRLEWLRPDVRNRGWGTVQIQPVPGVAIAGGAVVARRTPALLGEALGLIRPLRAPRSPVFDATAFEGPRGPSSAFVRGAAAVGSIRAGAASFWGLAGRGRENAALRAAGFSLRGKALALAAAAGSIGRERRALSLAAGSAGRAERITAEVLLSPERGPELLGEAIRQAGPLRVEARWRRRSGEARPVAGELSAESDSRLVRTRLSWRPWSARGLGDDGRIELETSFRGSRGGPMRLRLGSQGGEEAAVLNASRSERYAIADIGIARERGRSFSLLLSARESRRVGGGAVATAIGGRLELSARGRAGATLLMQARRAALDGGSAADAPAAWTTALAPSGTETLAARAGAGLAASGRGWIRLGGFRLEALLSDVAAAEGEGSSAGSLRIEWERMDQ